MQLFAVSEDLSFKGPQVDVKLTYVFVDKVVNLASDLDLRLKLHISKH